MSVTRGYAVNPATSRAVGCTGTTVPMNPAARRLLRISDPIFPRVRLAPTTATTLWREERAHGCGRGDLRSRRGLLDELVGDGEGQYDMAESALESNRLQNPDLRNTLEHLPIGGEHVGVEGRDSGVSSDLRELLEQTRADAVALDLVGYRKCHLGSMRRIRRR